MMMVDERGAVAARLAYVDDVTTPRDGPTFIRAVDPTSVTCTDVLKVMRP